MSVSAARTIFELRAQPRRTPMLLVKRVGPNYPLVGQLLSTSKYPGQTSCAERALLHLRFPLWADFVAKVG